MTSTTFKKEPRQILIYSHIPKTAGQTIVHLLRRNFGIRHIDVLRRTKHHPNVYTYKDMKKDLRLYPWAISISGHGPLASENYREFHDRLVWYTILRNPLERFLSHYQYRCHLRGYRVDFFEWIKELPYPNYQVRWFAGEQDLLAAKQIARERFKAIGLVEHFNESLLIFRHRLGVPHFNVYYERQRNKASSRRDRELIEERWDTYKDAIMEHNALDIELYDFVRENIWPKQVTEYGAERLERDKQTAFSTRANKLLRESRFIANMAYRNIIYKPFVRIDKGSKLQY